MLSLEFSLSEQHNSISVLQKTVSELQSIILGQNSIILQLQSTISSQQRSISRQDVAITRLEAKTEKLIKNSRKKSDETYYEDPLPNRPKLKDSAREMQASQSPKPPKSRWISSTIFFPCDSHSPSSRKSANSMTLCPPKFNSFKFKLI